MSSRFSFGSESFKKHLEAEGYSSGYLVPFPLFTPLSDQERQEITLGQEAFREKHPTLQLFPDPFFDESRPLPTWPLRNLHLVTGSDALTKEIAAALALAVEERWGFKLPVISDTDPAAALRSPVPLLLVGGADRNRAAMEIAKKYQVGAFCSDVPGEGGWGITTHTELEHGIALRYILTCDIGTLNEALSAFVSDAVVSSEMPTLTWVHRASPGTKMRAAVPDFETWIRARKSHLPQLHAWLNSGRPRPYREVFVDVLTQDYPSGLPSTSQLLDLGCSALRYYQWTAEPKALDLFREMMWGFWTYLTGANPQIYISDMDFRLGLLCNYWNWIEHHPSMTPEERRLFPKLLLGALRMVKGYFDIRWRNKPAPFNHQTHKARTLILGWRYFNRWNLPDLAEWQETAEFIFNKVDLNAFKYMENAGGYEAYIPEHSLSWLEATHRPVPDQMQEAIVQFARREWIMRDNFFFPVDYGDTEVVLERVRPFEVSPWLTGNTVEQEAIREIEASTDEIFPLKIPETASRVFSGTRHGIASCPFPVGAFSGWSRSTLDATFAANYQARGPAEAQFDKLAWRSGWKSESSYIAIEGIGKGCGEKVVSHAHHEANNILRMNLGGRIWLVNNGYGKREGIVSAGESRRTRQQGPEDHNMLVVRDPISGNPLSPPVNALVHDLGNSPLPFSLTALPAYGGIDWNRYLIVLPGIGFIFVDEILSDQGRDFPEMELQWNILGRRSTNLTGARFEQNGVNLDFANFGTTDLEWRESSIAAWRGQIASGNYPHTSSMPNQCIARPKLINSGECTRLVHGFWLADSVDSSNWNANTASLSIATQAPLAAERLEVTRPWGEIGVQESRLTITFQNRKAWKSLALPLEQRSQPEIPARQARPKARPLRQN